MENLLQGSNSFQGSCQKDEDCQSAYGYNYRCFVGNQKCYYCVNYYGYQCEGDTCWSNNNCALKMCVDSICAYEISTSLWMIILYVILGLISCCICSCLGVCVWNKFKKNQKQKKIDQRAKGDKSCQVLLEIFEAMSRRNQFFFNKNDFKGNVNTNLTIVEKDCFQNKAMAEGFKPIEFKTESIDKYLEHFSEHYGRYQKSYITEINNYSTSDTIKAIIITKTHYGQKVQYEVTAQFAYHKLSTLELKITSKLSYWQKQKKQYYQNQAMIEQVQKIPIKPIYYNNTTTTNNNFDDSGRRQEEENMRGAAYMQSQEASRRLQQEQERQQQQFRENMQRQEQQQREYQRQQQMIAEQRYREAQQAQMKYNNSRW